MEQYSELLAQYGYIGMFVASFIAGSVFPFSSEAVFSLMILGGFEPVKLFIFATTGNVLGNMFNYYVGRQGKPEWRERLMPKDPRKRERQERYIQRFGAWAGLFTIVPVLGSAISVLMGYMRLNPWMCLLSVTLSKSVRYAILALLMLGLM